MTIAREEGLAALYKGFIPKVLRLAPGGGVLLLVVEFTLGVFRKGNYSFFFSTGLLDFADDLFFQHWDLRIYNLLILKDVRSGLRVSLSCYCYKYDIRRFHIHYISFLNFLYRSLSSLLIYSS